VLGLCLTRLVRDWTERYRYAPVLAETFVDPRRFAGTCYRAANWRRVGQTAARPTAYPNGKVAEGPKDIYLYPLSDHWQGVLCVEPEVALGSTPRAEAPADWTEEEFARAPFFDERLKQRLFTLAADFFAQPGELIPQASHGSAAKTKAAYRFFQNPQVDMPKLLRPHLESTMERIRSHPVILAVQDTTTLNYTAHPPQGVGPINTRQDHAVGLVLDGLHARGDAAGIAQRPMLGARCRGGRAKGAPPRTAHRREGKPQMVGELPGRGGGPEALPRYDADQRRGSGSGSL
jgi:hypothetical protein